MFIIVFARNEELEFIKAARAYALGCFPGAKVVVRNIDYRESELEQADAIVVAEEHVAIREAYFKRESKVLIFDGTDESMSQVPTVTDVVTLADGEPIDIRALSVRDAKKILGAITDVDVLRGFLLQEADAPRATMVKLIQDRIEAVETKTVQDEQQRVLENELETPQVEAE